MGFFKAVKKFFFVEGDTVYVKSGELSDKEFLAHHVRDKTFVDWLILTRNREYMKFSYGERVHNQMNFKFSGVCSVSCAESFVRLMAEMLDMEVVKKEEKKDEPTAS